MSEFTASSKIELFRIRRHGQGSRFRFLTDGQQGYIALGQLATNFFVNRKNDTDTGARVEFLTFDLPESWNEEILNYAAFGDLIVDVDGTDRYYRYRVTSQTLPLAPERRAKVQLTANFGDTTPVFGVVPPDENPSLPPAIYDFVIGDSPTGAKDGSNTNYVATYNFVPASISVFVNGILQKKTTHYTLSGQRTVVLGVALEADDIIQLDYIRAV